VIQTLYRCLVCAVIALWSAISSAAPAAAASNTLDLPGVTVHVDFRGSEFTAGTQPVLAWIERSATIVHGYYGRFPVKNLQIRVISVDGRGVQGGTTFGAPQALIRVRVGREVTEAQLSDDWVLVHEMIHLALPDVGRDHAWLSEGLATYVEGIARAQAGNRAIADVWSEYMRSMPQGLPQAGDQGLDHTHTWGRTYWGGAIYCLLADVEIRRRSDNRIGLQQALQAIAEKSGGLTADWPISRVLATGDAALGMSVLQDLYDQMKDTPMQPDLPALWKRLGIELDGGRLRLHDDAPLAAIRKAITVPASSRSEEAATNRR